MPLSTLSASTVLTLALALSALAETPQYKPVKAELVRPREGLGNVMAKLRSGGPVRVAYLGGSITAADGWRVKSRTWLQQQFPQAKIVEIHAAIGGTGSDLGVFRMDRDVLPHKPDLLFVEFAVNDGGAPPERIWQAMEGIVRKTWLANPRTDICFVYTLHANYLDTLRRGDCPQAAGADELLADHYGIPSINVALRVAQLYDEGKVVIQPETPDAKIPAEKILFSNDGVHPLDGGHEIYAKVVADALTKMESSEPVNHAAKLDKPFVEDHWQAAKLVPLDSSMLSGDWKALPADAKLSQKFSKRLGTIWEASQPGATLKFRFRGSVAKLYDLVGPDGGQVTITVDGKTQGPVPRFDRYCTYPRLATLPVARELAPAVEHEVTIEIHPEQPDRSIVTDALKDDPKFDPRKYDGTNLRAGALLILGEMLPE